jgi:hypothetical protein
VVSIDVAVGGNAGTSAEQLFWAGASAVALSDALEGAGYRVEIFSTAATDHGNGKGSLSRMRVKASGEPMNTNLVAALMALPATFRWYHFNATAASPFYVGSSWGSDVECDTFLETAAVAGVIEGAEIMIPTVLNEDSAIKAITGVLKKLEVEQEEAEGVMG